MKNRWSLFILFFSFFGLYLTTVAPTLVPYRDGGEMVSVLTTLGVAHPPGYPLYTILGKAFLQLLPLGNSAFRVNVFSCLFSSLAIVFLFLLLKRLFDWRVALISCLYLGFSHPYWELGLVPEMYSLGAFWFVGLLYCACIKNDAYLFSFMLALGLGARMDMLLLMPLFFVYLWIKNRGFSIPKTVFFLGAGASVFFYLMVRSLQNPPLDWANPDSLLAVFRSASRYNYSGTLDLLSLSYQKGENFGVLIKFYATHILGVFGWEGALLGVLGSFALFRKNKLLSFFLSSIFLVTGPVFFYMANMPPNPHSLAIVEASFLIPDIMFAIFIGLGFGWILNFVPYYLGMSVVIACLAWHGKVGFDRANRRDNFYLRDYVHNVFQSMPKNSIGVFQKDVQLFSLWAAQLVDHRRLDVSLLATGLSASPWYWDMVARWKSAPLAKVSLKDENGFDELKRIANSRPVLMGTDVEMGGLGKFKLIPNGVLVAISDPNLEISRVQEEAPYFILMRGKYKYGQTPDFFSTDLIGDVSKAYHQYGLSYLLKGQHSLASNYLYLADITGQIFPQPIADLGYSAFVQNNFPLAYKCYANAVRKSKELLRFSIAYKSLPPVVQGCKKDLASYYSQLGAVADRMGKTDEAQTYYADSINTLPSAQAEFNMAVTYWNHDWFKVKNHLERALVLNPQMPDARRFLQDVNKKLYGQ